ncbi:hypothetical protein NTG1052_90017 [Candidatus Nitrotoga sp. 1052]|nr:hypothetical protein NTG1052_90017 [Candidatus Nitrotoga sp. 1052]
MKMTAITITVTLKIFILASDVISTSRWLGGRALFMILNKLASWYNALWWGKVEDACSVSHQYN